MSEKIYIQQYDSNKAIQFKMVSSSDHLSPATGATITLKISKNGAVLANPSGSVTEVGQGVYSFQPSVVDLNTIGGFGLLATASGCDETTAFYEIRGSDGIVNSPELPKPNQLDALFGTQNVSFFDLKVKSVSFNVHA